MKGDQFPSTRENSFLQDCFEKTLGSDIRQSVIVYFSASPRLSSLLLLDSQGRVSIVITAFDLMKRLGFHDFFAKIFQVVGSFPIILVVHLSSPEPN